MKKIYRILLPFAVLVSQSCTTDKCSGAYPLYVRLSGYEADTMLPVILSCCQGSFTNVLRRDTLYITHNEPYARVQADTGYRYQSSGFNVYAPFDWQIDVPSTGRRDRISGITNTEGSITQSWNPVGQADGCFDICTGYYLNGTYVSTGYSEATKGQQKYAHLELSK